MRQLKNKIIFNTWEKYQIDYLERTLGKKLSMGQKVYAVLCIEDKIYGITRKKTI